MKRRRAPAGESRSKSERALDLFRTESELCLRQRRRCSLRFGIPKLLSLLVSGNATRLLEVVVASRLPALKRHLAFLAPLVGPRLARLGVGDLSRRVGVGLGLLLLGRCYRTFTCNGFCSSWGSSARRDAMPFDLLALVLARPPRRRLVGSVA